MWTHLTKALLIVLVALAAHAEEPGWTAHNFHSRVTALAADSANLWIGTDGGLVKMDLATRERTFYDKTNSGLTQNGVIALFFDSRGTLWIGAYDDQVVSLTGDVWKGHTVSAYLNCTFVEDTLGRVWMGTSGDYGGGIRMYDGERWTNGTALGFPGGEVRDMVLDARGDLWLSAGGMFCGYGYCDSLLRYDGETWRTISGTDIDYSQLAIGPEGAVWTINTPTDLYRCTDTGCSPVDDFSWGSPVFLGNAGPGDVFAATNGWLMHYQGGLWVSYAMPGVSEVGAVCRDSGGAYWCGANRASDGLILRELVGDEWQPRLFAEGQLPAPCREVLFQDAGGAMWASGWEGELFRYESGSWSVLDVAGDSGSTAVTCAMADRSGSVWAGTDSGDVYVLSNQTWSLVEQVSSLDLAEEIAQLVQDSAGNVWMRTQTGRIVHYDGADVLMLDGLNPTVAVGPVLTVLAGRQGGVWLGTADSGVVHYDGSSWVQYPSTTVTVAVRESAVQMLYEDSQGRIWAEARSEAPTIRKLCMFDGASWTAFAENVVLAELDRDVDEMVQGIGSAPDGRVWVAGGEAVSYYSDSSWTSVSVYPTKVGALVVDREGTAWVGGRYLSWYSAEGRARSLTWENSGLPMSQDRIPKVTSLLEDRDGNIWMSIFGGQIAVYDNDWSGIGDGHTGGALRPRATVELRATHAGGVVTATFGVTEAGNVSVSVYNSHGQLIEVLASGNHAVGWHTLRWAPAGSGVAPGTYILRVEGSGTTASRLFQIIR